MLQRLSFFGIWYSRDVDFSLIWYSYGDYAGSIDNRKGTCGNVFSLGSGASSKQRMWLHYQHQKQNILLSVEY